MNEASIFAQALEKTDADSRTAYVANACAGDEKLRRRVEALLRVHDQSDDILDAPPMDGVTAAYGQLSERPGTVIGPYKLLQKIGEGGFGVVFMAEQTEPIRRMVALKIIKPGMDTAQVIARFESERQALALMDHLHIARVLDAGATASGRPYFVMELVKGVPITEFCDKNQLRPESRLRLFVDVCHAIQHAHHKGIVHRDIKPSNVLVTLHDGKPVVKVIGFGVAKATGQKLTEKTLFTAFGQMVGTPAYMSPEQAEMSGLDVDTRSDVYSLGVLLYELMTGTTPLEDQRLREAGDAELTRLIREEEPPRPSMRLSSLRGSATILAGNRGLDVRHLVQFLASDLDWAVMKALEKDRNRRYDTPAALAEDLERGLRREPILARPPSTLYKFRKLVQRNRVAALATAAVAAAVLLAIALTSWQAFRARAAEQRAMEAYAQTKLDRDRARGAEQRASQALQQSLEEQKRTETARAETKSAQGKADDYLRQLGAIHSLVDAMRTEYQGWYATAEKLYRLVLDEAEKEGFERGPVYAATLALADFYSRRNTPEKAEGPIRKFYEHYKRRHERSHTPKSDEQTVDPDHFDEAYVRALDLLGQNLLAQHKWADAEAILRKDVALRERLTIPMAPANVIQSVSANARSMLGASLVGQKRYAEAEPLLVQGYEGLLGMANVSVNGTAYRDMFMPMVKQAVERLVQLYDAWHKPAQAAKWRKELVAIKK